MLTLDARRDGNPFLASYFPQFCNFQKWPFTSCGRHGLGQDHPGDLRRCLLPKGMALAGGDSFFCEVHVGRGTVSLALRRWPVEGTCGDYSVLQSVQVKILRWILRVRRQNPYFFRNLRWAKLHSIGIDCVIQACFLLLADFLFAVQLIY